MNLQRGRDQSIHLAIVLGVFGLLAARYWFVCDDAYITFRYARNLAWGRGLVFNPGEFPPVEGYSDFLWLVGAFVFEAVGLRPDRWMPWISFGCGAFLVARVYQLLRGHLDLGAEASLWGALAVAASPAIGCWATSGLETMPQALLTFLLFESVVLQRRDAEGRDIDRSIGPAIGALALTLIRTEGLGWLLVVFAAAIVARLVDKVPLRPTLLRLARIAVPALALFGVYTAWRFQYYGTFVPNTALVKVGFGVPLLARGLKYVLLFVATCLTPLAAIAAAPYAARTERHGTWVAIAMLASAFPAYAVVVGGDFMPFGRLLVPAIPFVGLLIGAGMAELVRRSRGGTTRARWAGGALLLVSLLPSVDLHLVPNVVRRQLHFRLSDKDFLSELNRWQNQRENSDGFTERGLALAQVADDADVVVAAAVGAVGYWSGITVLDQHGLVTKEVAYRPMPDGPLTQSPGHDKHVDPEYFVKYEPRFLYARAVDGKLAAGRMKDTIDQWEIKEFVKDRYVPDFYEVTIPDQTERTFLLVIRLRQPGEDSAQVWYRFPARRRALNAELRAENADDGGDAEDGDDGANEDGGSTSG